MNRASLLRILDHVSEISDAEIRELEQLATTFPYCQTAHLLLAKAAHDRGSMLASQRLRRAATYATDRGLLRQLIEPPALVAPPAHADEFTALTPDNSSILVANAPEPVHRSDATESLPEVSATPAFLSSEVPAEPANFPVVNSILPDPEQVATQGALTPIASDSLSLPAVETREGEADAAVDEVISAPSTTPATTAATEPAVLPASASTAAPSTATNDVINSGAGAPDAVAAPTPDAAPVAEPGATSGTEKEAAETETTDDLVPAVTPPIRPPAEVGSSRFEFGLADPSPGMLSVYELPRLDDTEGEDEAPAVVALPAFYGAEDVGYALGLGSRLGYCLQSPDELTLSLPAQTFFPPDALLLAHVAAHQPPPARTSGDLISQFLRNKPRLKAPALPPASVVEEQADLSVRSTRAEPDLASESLAFIMMRQGKKAKAIEIYERLMVRQPEKMAYFADQIQKLKLSE